MKKEESEFVSRLICEVATNSVQLDVANMQSNYVHAFDKNTISLVREALDWRC